MVTFRISCDKYSLVNTPNYQPHLGNHQKLKETLRKVFFQQSLPTVG